MFSVVIPLYNKAPYVAKAIQSVATQTYQEFELLVIDDGSKDGGFEIAKKLLDALTPPLGGWGATCQSNAGVSSTRNKAAKRAKYPYIAFLDADDWWEPTFLEEMKQLIEEFPEAGIYGSSYYKVKNGRSIPANIGVEAGFEKGYIDYCKVYAKTMWMPLWTGAVIVPKPVYEELDGFKPELKLGEDFHLWIRIADKYKVAFLNKPLSNYNQDVDLANRAVGDQFYLPHEHMLFADYSLLKNQKNFQFLFQKLAASGLLPYYLAKRNKAEVVKILSVMQWKHQPLKYRLYYQILPHDVVKWWFKALKMGAKLKRKLNKRRSCR